MSYTFRWLSRFRAVSGGFAAGQGREADYDPRHGRSQTSWKGGGFYRNRGTIGQKRKDLLKREVPMRMCSKATRKI